MLSIVVPVFNEEEALLHFYDELIKFLPRLDKDFEVIFVDDGSSDNSLEILKKIEVKDRNIRIYSFRKNLGKSEALTLGFSKAKGDYIVTLDADLQDQPSEIHKLISLNKQGVEVVSGWRKDRRDKSNMKIISRLFNFFAGWIFDLHLHDYNCGLKSYTNEAAKSLRLYGGLHRFIPLLASEQGFSVDEVVVEHAPRKYGKSKYGFSKLWKDLPDMFTVIFLTKFGKRPLHFFGIIGGLLSLVGFLILGYLAVIWLMGETIGRRPLLFFGMLLVLAGLQTFFTGFLADLMINISHTPIKIDALPHFPIKYSSEPKSS